MALRMESVSALLYGAAVTGTDWWDNKRIDEGKISKKDILKKASFYTYLGLGLIATLANIMGWMRRWEVYTTPMAHGFLFGLPGFIVGVAKSQSNTASNSNAVAQANRIAEARMAQLNAASRHTARVANRTYEEQFDSVGIT